jgi:hypothetical protein
MPECATADNETGAGNGEGAERVAPSTPGDIGPLVLCHLPAVTAAADSLRVRICQLGAG